MMCSRQGILASWLSWCATAAGNWEIHHEFRLSFSLSPLLLACTQTLPQAPTHSLPGCSRPNFWRHALQRRQLCLGCLCVACCCPASTPSLWRYCAWHPLRPPRPLRGRAGCCERALDRTTSDSDHSVSPYEVPCLVLFWASKW